MAKKKTDNKPKHGLAKKARMSKTSKILMASALTVTAVGSTVVGGVQEAKAASTYVWNKYEAVETGGYTETATFLGSESAHHFAATVNGTIRYLEDDNGTGRWLAVDYWITTYEKGKSLGIAKASDREEYPDDGVKDGFFYEYKGLNTPPNQPSLNVPSQQFEHGDTQYINFQATDPDGDSLTYDLEASYNYGSSWSTIYSGKAEAYKYTVPQTSQVQFRVKANDGQASSSYSQVVTKGIQAPQYYWNKFENSKTEETLLVVTSNMEYADFSDAIAQFTKEGYEDFYQQSFFFRTPDR